LKRQIFKKQEAFFTFFLLFFLANTYASSPNGQLSSRITELFDQDWRFLKTDTQNAEKPSFDDTQWRRLNVPHDWSMEDTFDQNNKSGRGGAYLPGRIGWYRKTFILPDNYGLRRIFIEFDGIMANSDVWINGFLLGKRPYGYVSFSYELTGHLNFGKVSTNIIAVRVDNSQQPASRWYTGSGIYRHVRLVVKSPVHIDQCGVFITTPEVTVDKALVRVKTTLVNQSVVNNKVILNTSLIGPDEKIVQTSESTETIFAGKSVVIQQDITIKNPQLWNLDKPNIYKVSSRICIKKEVIDEAINTFGIRKIRFDAATGFYLNDSNLKIKGVCLHQDGGAFGVAVPLRVWERRFELLKKIGVNAIRTAHNPVAPEFLDLCDRMGFLVMSEFFDTWTALKKPANFGYHLYFKTWWKTDMHDVIIRDRNHPCIILYSVGNEIHDNLNNEEGFKRFIDLRDLAHSLDSTRPVTMALFRPNNSNVYKNGFAELMDIVGQNYRENELIDAHNAKPERKVIGTENGHSLKIWSTLRDNPFMIGQFLWAGVDYNGEEDWPYVVSDAGLMDRTGALKPRAYERQSWWSDKPMVYIARNVESTEIMQKDGSDATDLISKLVSDWTPRNIETYKTANVQVFSNCEEVELLLNEHSLGSKARPSDESPYKWSIPFEPGTIKAIGKNKGQVLTTYELRTATQPFKISLTADKSGITDEWDDLSYITATIVDKDGIQCPEANLSVKFDISGPGIILAVDNGDRASKEPVQAQERRTFKGQCIAIVRAMAPNGKITIKATAKALTSGSVIIEAVK